MRARQISMATMNSKIDPSEASDVAMYRFVHQSSGALLFYSRMPVTPV